MNQNELSLMILLDIAVALDVIELLSLLLFVYVTVVPNSPSHETGCDVV